MAEFLRMERICKDFVLRQGPFRRTTKVVHAVREVTLDVPEGATFGLVGESGSGKSTLARLILGLETPTSGAVWLRGRKLHELSGKDPKAWHREAQLIFQDAYGALSPRMRTGRILAEPLRLHGRADKASLDGKVAQLLRQVGLDPALADRFPHQLSGGQRQRVAIARALAVGPTLLVCDEPVSALDVSVQATILHLLQSLQKLLGFPQHPYTRALLEAMIDLDRLGRRPQAIPGDSPDPGRRSQGCPFVLRCPAALDRCREERPGLRQVSDNHLAACHLFPSDKPG